MRNYLWLTLFMLSVIIPETHAQGLYSKQIIAP